MTSDTQANLHRIRDNQRRSRARRREYVKSLEDRVGLYKREGAEVTYHIQQAAQRVADQNQKMRILLNTLGFNDERIDSFLQNGSINPMEAIASDLSPPSTSIYSSDMNITDPSVYEQVKSETFTASFNECFHIHDAAIMDPTVTGITNPGYSRSLPSQSYPSQTQDELMQYTKDIIQLSDESLAHDNQSITSPDGEGTTIYDQACSIANIYPSSPNASVESIDSTIFESQVLASTLQHYQNHFNSVSVGNYGANSGDDAALPTFF
ncbi:hypothetical protein K445DRAFT_22446 [Daldinia sp. EC12]|nr:hypothetical protein K445DRAFT_22446 [Daldinia sp. EC12]